MGKMISVLTCVTVLAILAFVAVAAHTARLFRRIIGLQHRPRPFGEKYLLLTGTFYNEGWFRSHILPLAASEGLGRIFVVTDEPLFDVQHVTYVSALSWATKVFGRVICRMALVMYVGIRERPDLFMGYHIMPNALICLVAARLCGGQAIYQMTGGSTQIIGGGWQSENWLLRRLGGPSIALERLIFHVIRQFDWIIVRGPQAMEFLAKHRLASHCAAITGSVDVDTFHPRQCGREYDIVYVSRLVPCKGLEYFLFVLKELTRRRPTLRAAIVGDGPLMRHLREQAMELGISTNVEFLGRRNDMNEVFCRSRLFMLLSPREGMSIAMLEAMASGLPAVVTDVGELSDMLGDGKAGILVNQDSPEETAAVVDSILCDSGRLVSMALDARHAIETRASVKAIASRWNAVLNDERIVSGRQTRVASHQL
jgi:glycosyltransferase involved in cell wall biosynthesis